MGVRIGGLVRFANLVRRELAQPISAQRKAQLRREIDAARAQVDRIVAEAGLGIDALPSPSRRAYRFLADLDLDALSTSGQPVPSRALGRLPGTVRLTRLKTHWEYFLQELADRHSNAELNALHAAIGRSSAAVEAELERGRITASDLTPQSRTIRGWLGLLAQRPYFDAYVTAVGHARTAFDALLPQTRRFQPPARVQFRPIAGVYRLRGYAGGTHVILPTPMICFSGDELRLVARAALAGGPREAVTAALQCEACQDLRAELDSLAGVTEQPRGVHHDLAASFERVARVYFDGAIGRPRLTWNHVFTGRKFGHYDPIRDAVMISCTLDRPDMPAFAVDFVMYHELLHKVLGVTWRDGRAAAHTPEFRAREARFRQVREAQAALAALAGGR